MDSNKRVKGKFVTATSTYSLTNRPNNEGMSRLQWCHILVGNDEQFPQNTAAAA